MAAPEDIARKLPVWTAFSDLFLDTELQEEDYARIAAVLGASGFSPAELERILADEVAPAFGSNLLQVAGEWAPWSEEEVRAIMQRPVRKFAPLRALTKWMMRRHVREEWAKLRPRLDR